MALLKGISALCLQYCIVLIARGNNDLIKDLPALTCHFLKHLKPRLHLVPHKRGWRLETESRRLFSLTLKRRLLCETPQWTSSKIHSTDYIYIPLKADQPPKLHLGLLQAHVCPCSATVIEEIHVLFGPPNPNQPPHNAHSQQYKVRPSYFAKVDRLFRSFS